jgi:glycosyltransferase involved in cell wall biosynthesis
VLRRDRPDALVVGSFKKLWLVALAAKLAGIRRVIPRVDLQTDTPRNAKYRWIMRNWIDRIVLCSDTPRADYARLLPELSQERVVTIHSGVTPRIPTRTRAEMRQELGLAPDARVIGAVARLAEQKRFDRLLEAMKLLPKDVQCIIAGDGPLGDELRRLATTLGVADRVRFIGHRDDVGNVLMALDLFVVSSDKEGLANAMLEALFLGIPVVSTAVSGALEALEPLEDGSVPGLIVGLDAGELAAAIQRVLDEPAERQRMSDNAIRRARDRFDFDKMIGQWERMLAAGPATN